MQTTQQIMLVDTLISQLTNDEKKLCEPIINYLVELGYTPKKHKKSSFAIEFEKSGRIIAKMETGGNPKHLTFWLRFSACKDYSKIFEDAVARRPDAWIKRNQKHVNHNIENCCNNCKGNPRFYHFINSNGDKIERCGGFTLPISGVTYNELPELLKLIKEQDAYFTDILLN